MSAPTPGWYPNPDGSDSMRYWDGQQWTVVQANGAPTIPTATVPTSKKRGRKIAGGIALAILGFTALGAITGGGDSEGSADKADKPAASSGTSAEIRQAARDAAAAPANAELQCEELVTKQADSPSTVDFPDRHTTRLLANGAHQVRGVVDAQNRYGATVRADFVCTSTPNGDGTYAVVVNELEQRGN